MDALNQLFIVNSITSENEAASSRSLLRVSDMTIQSLFKFHVLQTHSSAPSKAFQKAAFEPECKGKCEDLIPNPSRLTPICPLEIHQHVFSSLTRRLSVAQQQAISEIAEQRSKEIDELCAAAQKGDLEHPLFCQKNKNTFPQLALAAFKVRKLSLEDLCDILMFYAVLKYHDKKEIKIIKIFTEDGQVNLETKEILEGTMELNYKHSSLVKNVRSNRLSKQQFTKFYTELKKLSPLQQQFWVVKDLQGKLHDAPSKDYTAQALAQVNGESSISQIILEIIGTNTFGRIKDSGNRIISPLSLVQAYLNARFDRPIILEPIIGFGTIEDLYRNGLEHERIVSLAFPFEGLQDFIRADGYLIMQDYDMFYHDAVYHGNVVSAIPPTHRIAFIMLAEAIREVCNQPRFAYIEDLKSLAEKCFNRLVDMDYALYGHNQSLDPIICFFKSLDGYLTHSIISRLITQKLLLKKEEVSRNLSRGEVDVILAENSRLGSKLTIKLKEKTLMEEIGKAFVEKISKATPRAELKYISLKLKSILIEENTNKSLALSKPSCKSAKIDDEMSKKEHKFSSFSEAISVALDAHFARNKN